MKFTGLFLALCLGASALSVAQTVRLNRIEDYNALLPAWGVSWAPGANSQNGYYPTFYTGFVMRSEFPERIHIRVSRGNQTRVSVILDEATMSDYVFDLAKRYAFYKRMTSGPGAPLNIAPSGGKFLPQLSYFNQIIESPNYGILDFVARANQGLETKDSIYRKSIELLIALNPNHVYNLHIDLAREFAKWKTEMQTRSGGDISKIMSNPNAVVTAIDALVFGRINYTKQPTQDVLAKLNTALQAALQNGTDDQLNAACMDLFYAVTGTKYQIQSLDRFGRLTSAILCDNTRCTLNYPEYTIIYPTGSVLASTSDEFGNRINAFATVGLWQFVAHPGRSVDNIRKEPYYGFAPKMDFQDIGNGFHNPAVRFFDPSPGVKKALGIDKSHNTLWAAKRGGVSHGCLRLPLGAVWEMRQILPVESAKMAQVNMFASNAQDFDVFDIAGDGQLRVMGVQYFISYGLKGTDDSGRREGADFEVNNDKRMEFYKNLYGATNVFHVDANGQILFSNPHVSMPSYIDYKKSGVKTRVTLNGDFPLYEALYEKDKVQFYSIGSVNDQDKLIVRLMGRVKGCAPGANKQACGESAFDQEMVGLVR